MYEHVCVFMETHMPFQVVGLGFSGLRTQHQTLPFWVTQGRREDSPSEAPASRLLPLSPSQEAAAPSPLSSLVKRDDGVKTDFWAPSGVPI